MLEHGLRPDRRAAEAFVASPKLQRLSLADYRQRIEALRLFGHTLVRMWSVTFGRRLESAMMPRLVFVRTHACAPKHHVFLRCSALTSHCQA